MLPTSRNTTYAAGATAVKSADLNDLQDCIIAGKHGPIDIPLGGAAFSIVPGSNAAFVGGKWTFAAASTLYCPLRLPPGKVLNSIRWCYDHGGGGSSMFFRVWRRVMTAAAAATSADLTTINAGTGWTSTLKALGLTVLPNETFWLEVDCADPVNVFDGAIINVSQL